MTATVLTCSVPAVQTVCRDLFPQEVQIDKTGFEQHSSTASTYAVYRDDQKSIVAVCKADLELIANAAGAIAMVPAAVCQDAVKAQSLEDSLLDNATEIMNVFTTLVSNREGHRVFLDHFFGPGEALPKEVSAFLQEDDPGFTLNLNFKNYGGGVMSFYG